MALALSESLVLAKTRSQDLKSVLKLNCWNSGLADVSLVRKMVNVEVIGLSQNEITTLEDFAHCPKLKELTLRSNRISNIAELAHLQSLPHLTKLWLADNPCVNIYNYRRVVLKNLPNLTVLDNIPVTREELQEIEELGNEIYEEIPYESTSSGSSTTNNNNRASEPCDVSHEAHHYPINHHHQQAHYTQETTKDERQNITSNNNNIIHERDLNETSYFSPNPDMTQCSLTGNISRDISFTCGTNLAQSYTDVTPTNTAISSQRTQQTRLSMINEHQQLGRVPSQGSLNGSQIQSWSNNNSILPKGGKNRNANILSAVLCLVKELNYENCEVVLTALHCRMEEISS